MNRSLWLLIGLQLRGWLRSFVRSLRSVRGVVLAMLGLLVIVPWLILVWNERSSPFPPDRIRMIGPAFLLVYCLMNVLLSTGERAVYFSPAEVTFLFTGPFTRRELLVYKVAFTLLVSLPSALFFTAIARANAPWLLAGFIGLLLMFVFMQMFGMAISLAATTAGARAYSRTRKLVLALIGVAGVAMLLPLRDGGINGVLGSPAWIIISTPLRFFFEAFLAETWGHLLLNAALGLGVDFLLLAVVLGLDADYLEASASYSQRVYAKLQRLRGGPAFSGGGDGPSPPPRPRFSLPMLPRLGGVGPLVWRQLVTAVRSPSRLIGLVLTQVILTTAVFASLHDTRGVPQGSMPPELLLLFLSVFLTTMVPFDFRGDLDRLESLKTLPLSWGQIALGQMLAPALILTAFQALMLGGLAIFEVASAGAEPGSLTDHGWWLLGIAWFAMPFNFVLVGLENVLFLLFPSRLLAGSTGDFQAVGRNVLLMMAKLVTLGVVAGAAIGAGSIVYLFNRNSLTLGLIAAWAVLAAGAAAFVPVAGLAFRRLDLSRDKPA